jgi:hypothetical protein
MFLCKSGAETGMTARVASIGIVVSVKQFEDIFESYYDCRKHKRNRSGAMQFEVDLEKNLVDLWEEINNGTWSPRQSTVFIVDKPVKREIFAAVQKRRALFRDFYQTRTHRYQPPDIPQFQDIACQIQRARL